MSQITNNYPVFEGNQVLTSSQLNQMVEYLDQQNRLTRAKLIGTGVVCGLELSLNTQGDTPEIDISKGLGVSSEGFLLSISDCTVNRYKEYQLPSSFPYPPFVDPSTKQQDVSLFELISNDTVVNPNEDVYNLNDPSGFLDDKVVMLFLECVDIDLKSCLGQSCDERGLDRVFNIRKLLISKTDLITKVFPRTCEGTSAYSAKYNLPKFKIKRALFEPNSDETNNYFSFSTNYINQIRGDQFISNGNNDLYTSLFEALKQTYTDFASILGPVYGGSNPFNGYPLSEWTNFLNQQSNGPQYLGVQYFYDFIKDLILAYNEFTQSAYALMSECCPSMDCFPKHLLLGSAVPEETNCEGSQFRNHFTSSPALNNQKDQMNQLIMLHKRMVLMTRKFNLDRINNPSTEPVPPGTLGEPLFITPSNEKRDPLSMRSIPYYYNIDEVEANLGTLEENWSYKYIKQCLPTQGLEPLAYGNQDITQNPDLGPVKVPLAFDIDEYNFLRIEGAIRQNYVDVEAELDNIRSNFNLPFNYITLRLTGEPLDDITERCNFDDIRTNYATLRTNLFDISKDIFDAYATDDRGVVRLRPSLPYVNALLNTANSGGYGSATQPIIGYTAPVGQDDADTVEGLIGAKSTISNQPIYAPKRTMMEAVTYYQNNADQLVNKLNSLYTNFLPFDIGDFDFGYTGTTPNDQDGFIQTFLSAKQFAINMKVAQNQIIDLIVHSDSVNYSSELYADISQYFADTTNELNRLINTSSHHALTELYYTYQYRLQYLRDNDQNLFSNFIEKHPGIEHQAGVPKGGTYIMLVSGDPITISEESRDYAVSLARREEELIVKQEVLKTKTTKTKQDNDEQRRIELQLRNFRLIRDSLNADTPVTNLDIEPSQIIADFTLPYLCCCDCECEDIPYPTSVDVLNIPALSEPFPVQYNPGDFSYSIPYESAANSAIQAEGIQAMSVGDPASDTLVNINIKDSIIYDKSRYSASQIKLYVVDKNGTKLDYETGDSRESGDTSVKKTPMSTFNHPNNPGNTTQYGTAGVMVTSGVSVSLYYEPLPGFSGIDSFYYTFEIIDTKTGEVVQNGTRSHVTIEV